MSLSNPDSIPSQLRQPTEEQLKYLQVIHKNSESFINKDAVEIIKTLMPEENTAHIVRILGELKASLLIDCPWPSRSIEIGSFKSEPCHCNDVKITELGHQCLRDFGDNFNGKAQILKR
jgi:hypothetical protein